eukprot:augustus_masked-scaffold_33-processed-gene-3.59-mRNA-1 protein AED:1.00 eAED:1.00 QI:0/-1/0/0/-1/1/1/0/332
MKTLAVKKIALAWTFASALLVENASAQVDTSRRLGINLSTKFQSSPLTPSQVISAKDRLQSYLGSTTDFTSVKFFDFDSSVRDLVVEAAHSQRVDEIYLGIPNVQLADFAGGNSGLITELVNLVEELNPFVAQFHIAVGNEPFVNGVDGNLVSQAIDTLRNRLPGFPLSIPFSMAIFATSFPVADSTFQDSFLATYTHAVNKVDFFTINTYPFFVGIQEGVTLDTLLGPDMVIMDNQVSATRAALDRHFGYKANFQIVVGETGWPTAGNSLATPQNGFEYLRNAVSWIENTSRSGSKIARAYLFELLDENLKNGDETERHFGALGANGNDKF